MLRVKQGCCEYKFEVIDLTGVGCKPELTAPEACAPSTWTFELFELYYCNITFSLRVRRLTISTNLVNPCLKWPSSGVGVREVADRRLTVLLREGYLRRRMSDKRLKIKIKHRQIIMSITAAKQVYFTRQEFMRRIF